MSNSLNYPTGTLRILIVVTVMLVAIAEVLDMTIVTVALPDMMGTLGANVDQISWVLTSYIVSAAILMPLTGILINRLGRKRLLLINIIGFMCASAFCGMANTLSTMIFFRACQGVFGAALVPLSQTILRDSFPPKEIGMAMAIWGVGIMVAPVLGPTIGGYITQHLNWRFIFYINIPVCIIAFLLATRVISESTQKYIPIDIIGVIFLTLWVGCLQILLDRGTQEGWFNSNEIIILAVIAVLSFIAFIQRCWRNSHPIINLKLFCNSNFTLASLILAIFSLGLLGTLVMQPLLLENLLNYPTQTAGIAMAPRGIISAITMFFSAYLIKKIDARIIISIGILMSAISTFEMHYYSLQMDMQTFILVSLLQGIGMGLFFVPNAAIAFTTLTSEQVGEASGLFSFSRSLGTSIGISMMSTILARETQINWMRLGGHLTATTPALQQWLAHLHWQLYAPLTLTQLSTELANQSQMIAFIDSYWLTSILLLCSLPLVFFLKKINNSGSVETGH